MQNDKQVEVTVIIDSDAVVDPLAVMIESLHALVANVAMSGIGGADHFAFRAEQVCFKLFNETEERHV